MLEMRRLLYRFRRGRLPQYRLMELLQRELDSLLSRRRSLREQVCQEELPGDDSLGTGLSDAARALSQLRFEQAVASLDRAQQDMAQLEARVLVVKRLAEAQRRWAQLSREHELAELPDVPSLRIPPRLLSLVRSLLDRSHVDEATAVLRAAECELDRWEPADSPSPSTGPTISENSVMVGLYEAGRYAMARRLGDELGWTSPSPVRPTDHLILELERLNDQALHLRRLLPLSEKTEAEPASTEAS